MDKTALYDLSYGLYAIGAEESGHLKGCIVNTVIQVTSVEPAVALAINKDNYTLGVIERTKRFSVSILSEDVDSNVIPELGFSTGAERDKFQTFERDTLDGLPIVKNGCCGYLICDVINMTDAGSHQLILARVANAVKSDSRNPMTYKYYHDVVKGSAPKNAPTWRGDNPVQNAEPQQDGDGKYTCSVCEYVYEGDDFETLPDDYTCPLCGALKAMFVKM